MGGRVARGAGVDDLEGTRSAVCWCERINTLPIVVTAISNSVSSIILENTRRKAGCMDNGSFAGKKSTSVFAFEA